MFEDQEHTEVGLFCSDSSHAKDDLKSSEGAYDIYSDDGSVDGEYRNLYPRGMELYHSRTLMIRQR